MKPIRFRKSNGTYGLITAPQNIWLRLAYKQSGGPQ
jgi:hypothetical protein